jgi:hypothetical protein
MRKFFCLSFLSLGSLIADEAGYVPYYAGTLLAYFSENVDPGKLSFEPYASYNVNYGTYNSSWSVENTGTIQQAELLTLFETGITKNIDITIYAPVAYTWYQKEHSYLVYDCQAYLGFQFLRDQKGTSIPDFRLLLGVNFPTGKYQNLNPDKNLSDVSGDGAYAAISILVLRKIFYPFPMHPFNIDLNLSYEKFGSANVSGLNLYGGAPGSRGKVRPGSELNVNLATEISLTQNWVAGLDLHYLHEDRSIAVKNNTVAALGLPSSDVFSLSPCLEYNYSESFGIEGGVWFTVAGRNNTAFVNTFLTVYVVF